MRIIALVLSLLVVFESAGHADLIVDFGGSYDFYFEQISTKTGP